MEQKTGQQEPGREQSPKRTAQEVWSELSGRVLDAVGRGLNAMEAGVEFAANAADASYEAAAKMAGSIPPVLQKASAEFLLWMAGNPESIQNVIIDALRVTPGIGTAKRYSDAWRLYQDGRESGNQEKMEKARADCLRACLSAAVDLAALGNAAIGKSAAPIAQFMASASIVHLVSMIPQVETEVIAPLIDNALKHESVRNMVDEMLSWLEPPVAPADSGTAAETGSP